jgi:uncharacterized OB-fold protein
MPFHDRQRGAEAFTQWPVSIDATYLYTAGVGGTRFFEALQKEGKILATQCKDCDIEYLPPRIYCERCFADLSGSWHEVATSGVVAGFTVMRFGLDGKLLDRPEVRALVRMGKGTGGLIHRVLADPAKVKVGAKVKARLKPKEKRQGNILDIDGFELAKSLPPPAGRGR